MIFLEMFKLRKLGRKVKVFGSEDIHNENSPCVFFFAMLQDKVVVANPNLKLAKEFRSSIENENMVIIKLLFYFPHVKYDDCSIFGGYTWYGLLFALSSNHYDVADFLLK